MLIRLSCFLKLRGPISMALTFRSLGLPDTVLTYSSIFFCHPDRLVMCRMIPYSAKHVNVNSRQINTQRSMAFM